MTPKQVKVSVLIVTMEILQPEPVSTIIRSVMLEQDLLLVHDLRVNQISNSMQMMLLVPLQVMHKQTL